MAESVDIAVRIRERLDTDGDLQMKRISVNHRILAASRALLEQYGPLRAPADLARFPTLHASEQLAAGQWMLSGPGGAVERVAIEPRVAAGDFALLLEAAVEGLGVGLVPELVCVSAWKFDPVLECALWGGQDEAI